MKEDVEPVLSAVQFEPSDFYLHDVLRFKMKHASLKDKVAGYNEANRFWEKDKFIQSCHGKDKPSDKSREGRKLRIAEYHHRMQHKPL